MKYIEVPALGLLAAVISGRQDGVSRVCRIDKYLAGKMARRSRHSAREIEDRILRHLEEQPDSPELTYSALGDMHLQASRKLLANLITTLNSASPDLTFECVPGASPSRAGHAGVDKAPLTSLAAAASLHSGVSPADFVRAGSLMDVAQAVNARLADVDGASLLTTLWSSIDRAVGLKECDIFTFVGDQPEEDGGAPNLYVACRCRETPPLSAPVRHPAACAGGASITSSSTVAARRLCTSPAPARPLLRQPPRTSPARRRQRRPWLPRPSLQKLQLCCCRRARTARTPRGTWKETTKMQSELVCRG